MLAMPATLDHVELPEWLHKRAGLELRHPGSRWWQEVHRRSNLFHFLRDVNKAFPADLVPLQWVPKLVNVSRESVLRRAKRGGLTVVSFVPLETKRNILGGVREKESRNSFDFALISECEQWRDLLIDRADMAEESVKRDWE